MLKDFNTNSTNLSPQPPLCSSPFFLNNTRHNKNIINLYGLFIIGVILYMIWLPQGWIKCWGFKTEPWLSWKLQNSSIWKKNIYFSITKKLDGLYKVKVYNCVLCETQPKKVRWKTNPLTFYSPLGCLKEMVGYPCQIGQFYFLFITALSLFSYQQLISWETQNISHQSCKITT